MRNALSLPLASLRRRAVWTTLVVAALALASTPSGAQDLADELDELRQEQAQVKEDRAAQARNVDAATAEAGDLSAALEVMNADVNAQATKVAEAEQRLAAAEAREAAAVDTMAGMEIEIADLEVRLSERAISSFVSDATTESPLLSEADPTTAVRMHSLVEAVTDDGISVADELRSLREDMAIERAAAEDAAAEAETIRADLAVELEALEQARSAQAALVEQAELRLEAQLAEAAALADLDQELAAEIEAKTEELATQTRVAQDRGGNSSSSGGDTTPTPSFPSAGEIVNVQGIWVHQDIAGNVDAMLSAATAAGHSFSGGGYRDPAAQIRLRRAHCGTSQYAIYQMPSSQCTPPTARPGRSNHEKGLAMDLKYNGSLITSRSNAGFQWLAANAAGYGFYNLPSEPWHWSVDGR